MIVPIETIRLEVAALMLAGVPMAEAAHSVAVSLGLTVEAVQDAIERDPALDGAAA